MMKSSRNKYLLIGVATALAVCMVDVLIMITFDWNRAKPWLSAKVSEATGRAFVVHGNLSMQWHQRPGADTGWRGWIPWPWLSAQDVTFGNPAWAAKSVTMAEVKDITFSINPLSLLSRHIVIPVLYLHAPTLSLERSADGKNNWTFKSEDASNWTLELQNLVLDKGILNFRDATRKLDLKANVDTLSNDQSTAYGVSWKVHGSFGQAPVNGSGMAGAVLSLQKTDVPYPLEANVEVGKTTVTVVGTLAHPGERFGVDLQLKLHGASLAHLYALTGMVLPETPAYTIHGHLQGLFAANNSEWSYNKFTGKVGSSDVSGTLEYQSERPRPLLQGAIVSELLKLEDLGPLIGLDTDASKANRDAPLTPPSDKVLPIQKFHTYRWSSIDADVKFTARKIVRKKLLPVQNLTADIRLQDSVLSLAPISMDVASGSIDSNLVFDGHTKTTKANMEITARHLKLNELFPDFQPMHPSMGEINADASLSATGNSVAALLGSSNGEIKMLMDKGTISKLLLEEIGMNFGNVILINIFGDEQVAINCLAGDFTVTEGLMRDRVFVIDTETALLGIDGTIDLSREQLDLVVMPGSKGLRILSLRSPIHVDGSFKEPRVSVDKGVLALKAAGAIALAIATPLAALLPLMNIGTDNSSECVALLDALREKPVAPPPGKSYTGKTGNPVHVD